MKTLRTIAALAALFAVTLGASAADAWTHLHGIVIPNDNGYWTSEQEKARRDELGVVRLAAPIKWYASAQDAEHKLAMEWLRRDAHTAKRLLAALRQIAADMPKETAQDRTRIADVERIVAILEKDIASKTTQHEGRALARRWLESLPKEPPATKPTREQVKEAKEGR